MQTVCVFPAVLPGRRRRRRLGRPGGARAHVDAGAVVAGATHRPRDGATVDLETRRARVLGIRSQKMFLLSLRSSEKCRQTGTNQLQQLNTQ